VRDLFRRNAEAWRLDYNTVCPRSTLAGRTPQQFANFTVGARRPPPSADGKSPTNEDP